MPTPLNPNIYFLIVVPDWNPEKTTPLQGFSFSLCRDSWMIRAVNLLPSNIYDFTKEGLEYFLARRISGVSPVNWYPQSPRAIQANPLPVSVPFTVMMLGKDQDPEDYVDWAKSSEVLPTIVAEKGGDLKYDEFHLSGLQQRFLGLCDAIPNTIDREDVDQAKQAIEGWRPITKRRLGYQVGGHATITPNLMALTVAGFDDLVYGPFKKINDGIQPYVDQIVSTTRSVFGERNRIGEKEANRTFRRPPDLNIFAPAIYPHAFSLGLHKSFNREDRRHFGLVKTILERQSGYAFEVRTEAGIKALSGASSEDLSSRIAKPNPHFLMQLRQMELSLCTECIGSLAASEISAVIRLPNEINRTAGSVRQFSSHYRGQRTSNRKRLLAFRQLQSRLSQAFPPEFYELIKQSQDGIRILSDAHVEWLDLDGLPLGIRKNVSRIPVTPGNLFVEQVGAKQSLHLTPEDFRDVLVISGLKRDDPISGLFDIAFEAFQKHWADNLNIQFVEASNEDELVSALNNFSGPLVVFDGHGSHAPNKPASLHLMDTEVDVWNLRDKIARPPPIVILSACDTHAADRNHATTANGFLSIGSRAVLGSVFPLDAANAAIFTVRLLFRIASFIPAAIGLFGRALTWTEVISGMLRMQLLTDFLRQLERKSTIDHAIYIDVHEKGNFAINSGQEDPFQEVENLLIAHGVEEKRIRSELEIAVANSSVISYLNVGRPETILIDTEERLRE